MARFAIIVPVSETVGLFSYRVVVDLAVTKYLALQRLTAGYVDSFLNFSTHVKLESDFYANHLLMSSKRA
jgi:hypothetical protein